ncbi:MAG: ABC transporter ATP-binding protein [Spirochaetaceae bacterium]|nr:MAG: ABC transporter ATP-binding protein [Spirochaetaceae bacterium]
MIGMEQIVRRYPDFHLEVDFAVQKGEIVTLLGHSGSGKTTTLRILAGFEKSDTGRILLDGEDVTALPAQKRGLGYVFQDYTLFPHLDVGENIAYGLRVKKVSRPEQGRRVRELLELVGLEGFENRPIETLSGGEQQRVAVARALAPGPRALLLDEPFSAIDTERRESLRRHLLRVQRELRIPTVFVTHSRTEALFLSDRILILREGAVEDAGTPQQLYEHPRTEYAARFLGAANILPREEVLRVLGDDPDNPAGPALLMIRPERVRVSRTGPIPARITDRAYYGAWHEYTLDTPLGPILAVTGTHYEPGAALSLDFPREHLVPLVSTAHYG